MSKRWKVRKQNAAKLERSREVIDQFYGNVISELERLKTKLAAEQVTTPPEVTAAISQNLHALL